MKKTTSGFTIVELLIVIVVIAILAAISIVAFSGIQERSRDSHRASDIAALEKALEMYRVDNGHYPTNAQMYNSGWIVDNLNGVNEDTIRAPGVDSGSSISSHNSVSGTDSITPNDYNYRAANGEITRDSSGNYVTSQACITSQCPGYVMIWRSERSGELTYILRD